MVKAMAPSAPSGATRMMMPTTLNIACETCSMVATSGRPAAPVSASAKPNSTAKNSTCRMLPSAKAPMTLAGMTSRTKSITPCGSLAALA